MLNIVIPMAGAGSRFVAAGYRNPKPLILVHSVPMIKLVIDNLKPKCNHRFIFICQKSHVENYELRDKLSNWAPGCEIIELDGLTQGAACTVYAAKDLINFDDPVMIANSDQYIDCDIDKYLESLDFYNADGLIMTMKANDPKWSFVGFSSDGKVAEIVEKKVISDEATVGIYNFRSGRQLCKSIESMIEKNLRVNGEFYVAPVYNEMIEKGANLVTYNIGSEGNGMYGLGIPADLDKFLSLPISLKATLGNK